MEKGDCLMREISGGGGGGGKERVLGRVLKYITHTHTYTHTKTTK
jgi:hypothetical protein